MKRLQQAYLRPGLRRGDQPPSAQPIPEIKRPAFVSANPGLQVTLNLGSAKGTFDE